MWHSSTIHFYILVVLVKDTRGENNLFYLAFINMYRGKITKYSLNYYLTRIFDSLYFINFNLKFAHKYYSGMFKLIH